MTRGHAVLALLGFGLVVGCGGGTSATPDAGTEDAAATQDATDPQAEAELRRIVAALADDAMGGRAPGTAGGAAARAFLAAEWTRCGIAPIGDTFEQPIGASGGVNLVGRIAGADPTLRERHLVLSAHYDHIGECGGAICNGAYDNATAVAAVVQVACALAASPPARSVLVAHWDAEEPPAFLTADMGSEYFAAHPLAPLASLDAAIVLDLVGEDLWPGYLGHFVLGAETSAETAAAVAATAVPAGLEVAHGGLHLVEETPFGHQPWSDYDAFRTRGVPVVFLSDGQNKRYHEPSDDVDGVDFPKLAREAAYLLALTRGLANATATPVFVAGGADHASDAATALAALTRALGAGGIVAALGLGADTRAQLAADLAAVTTIAGRLQAGGVASAADLAALRRGVQRLMCLAGPLYDEAVCAML
ncbi:MAG TPA: M28 family peptidase [Polyangia bacterium]